MKFSEVVDALMAGKRVRKTNWHTSTAYLIYDKDDNTFYFYENLDGENVITQISTTLDLTPRDLIYGYWEVIE